MSSSDEYSSVLQDLLDILQDVPLSPPPIDMMTP
jgi:hypothetical protein